MDDEVTNRPSREETAFVRQVAAKAARKLKVQRDGSQSVWFGLGMSGLDRLVGSGANDPWRDARPLVGPAPSGSPFLDAHAASRRIGDWVC